MRIFARCTSSPTARHDAEETRPSIATTRSFSISFRAFCTATPGLASSSVISSIFRPRTPPVSFSSSTASVAPCLPYSPIAPRKPVNGMSCPMRMRSCARTTAGKARWWVPAAAPAAASARKLRRVRRVEPGFVFGCGPEDSERGRAVRMKITLEAMVKDVRAAVKALTAEKLKVGVVGYCLGGTLAWLAATRIDGVACAVGYYGGGIADTASETPRCPVLLHFGETDQSIPTEHHTKIRAAHPTLPMHLYPAGHGFNCDERASYHEPSAILARSRTLDFVRRHLG